MQLKHFVQKPVLISLRQVAERVKTAKVVKELAKKFKVGLPVCKEVYRVLCENEILRNVFKLPSILNFQKRT